MATTERKHATGARNPTALKAFLRRRREKRRLRLSKAKAEKKKRNMKPLGIADIRPFCEYILKQS